MEEFKMIEIGRLCIKIAGRDANRKCVIVDILDDNLVLIDGNVRRRKCNINHLELLGETIKIKKGASHDIVKQEFKKLKLDVWETKPKKVGEKPKKLRKKERKEIKEKEEPKKKSIFSLGKGKEKKEKKAEKTTEKEKREVKEISEQSSESLSDKSDKKSAEKKKPSGKEKEKKAKK